MIQLARIGGTDIKSITFNILRCIMSDSVGSMFSYVGGKKKYPFFDLHLRKIICGKYKFKILINNYFKLKSSKINIIYVIFLNIRNLQQIQLFFFKFRVIFLVLFNYVTFSNCYI